MKNVYFITAFSLLGVNLTAFAAPTKPAQIHRITVEKSKRSMKLWDKQGNLIKAYNIALGFAPMGQKTIEGDGKTPEGCYKISGKYANSQFHRSLRVSYPTPQQMQAAKKANQAAGGDIMIHGLGRQFAHMGKNHTKHDWTLGCIAVTNDEIEEIYANTPFNTPIEITP